MTKEKAKKKAKKQAKKVVNKPRLNPSPPGDTQLDDQVLRQAPPFVPDPPESPPPKSDPAKAVVLDLVIRRSDGKKDVYPVDSLDVGSLVAGPLTFIEVPTQKTPGVRFVDLRWPL